MLLEFITILFALLGFAIGLGAVLVIDIHGLLGRKSQYWSEATLRTHKVTKPMIWVGITLVAISGSILYLDMTNLLLVHIAIMILLILNGIFLSFYISPLLLKREKQGRGGELLPQKIQRKIAISLLFSDTGWWASLLIFVYFLTNLS